MMKERPDSVIRKRSLAEELAERLRQRITDGQFEVGEKLPAEPELMRIFGIGRSTVREAVKILVNMGFLKVQQGAGTFVESRAAADDPMAQRLRRADIRDLDEVRRILEVAIVERAAGRRTEQDIEKIERFLAERGATAAAGRLEACIEADIRFHVALAEATHNEILYELYRSATIHLQKGFEHIYVAADARTVGTGYNRPGCPEGAAYDRHYPERTVTHEYELLLRAAAP